MSNQQAYWSNRYEEGMTGWDIGYPSTPLKIYFDQLKDKSLKILIPGAGNAYEAEYLFLNGFQNVYILDISQIPLKAFQKRVPDFPKKQLIQANFFDYEGQFDLIIEQTFFCSFVPTKDNRLAYAKQMHQLLYPQGKLVGLWFKHPLIPGEMEKRPFGGDMVEYKSYFDPFFKIKVFEDCYNSIPPRQGNELFAIMSKK